ncbi:MAG TPA: sigma-70 family RNA polymerase sigma factor [Pyrinomonadaceae bacterium]|nr:sigma-70 family RNA polymerase sigma factor [Pyrinomonadaceae bacterium]
MASVVTIVSKASSEGGGAAAPRRMTDEKLLQQAGRGDEAAFLALYERHRATVFRFAYRMLGSAALAEELTHDCFLSLVRRPAAFDPSRAQLRTYLYAAVRNLSAKHLRRHGGEFPVEDLTDEPAAAEREGPLGRLLDAELSEEVRRAVMALPPLQREVVALVEFEELSLAETASVVGADVGTVKSRLHRARRRLRRELYAYFKSDRGGVASAGKV